MAVRVVESAKRIVVRDNPFPFWTLNVTTLVSAIVVFLLAFYHLQSSVLFFAAAALAEFLFGIGVWYLLREPATICVFDQDQDTLVVARWYMLFRKQEKYPLRALERAEIEEVTRIDGSQAFRPVVHTVAQDVIPLSVFWYAPAEYNQCRGVIDKVNLAIIFS